jgi:hypothetical protein
MPLFNYFLSQFKYLNKILRTHSRSTDRDEIPGGRQPLNAIAVPLDLQLIAGDLYCTLVSLYCNQLLISVLQYKLIAQHDIAINCANIASP